MTFALVGNLDEGDATRRGRQVFEHPPDRRQAGFVGAHDKPLRRPERPTERAHDADPVTLARGRSPVRADILALMDQEIDVEMPARNVEPANGVDPRRRPPLFVGPQHQAVVAAHRPDRIGHSGGGKQHADVQAAK
ncbi:hypothetical protein D9M69_660230 [compost metagenome]